MGRLRLSSGSITQKDGAKGETMVLWYLRLRGYRLLERNYTVGHKEIDLIMRKGNTIAFVEVKSRRKIDSKMPPRMNVDWNKHRNIIAAAGKKKKKNGLTRVIISFDIAEVDLDARKITYIKNAFTD